MLIPYILPIDPIAMIREKNDVESLHCKAYFLLEQNTQHIHLNNL